ncbi:MAG: hypothetical protein WC579_01640 [Candidatus Paceibacterota bacterium]
MDEVVNYPLTNIKDVNKNTYFKSDDVSGQGIIKIDMGSVEKSRDYIALIGFNMVGTNLKYKLTYSEDLTTYYDVFAWQNVTSSTIPTITVKTFSAVNWRYFKLNFSGNVGAKLSIGTILFGKELNLSHNPEMDISWGNEFMVGVYETPNGIRYGYSENETRRKMWELSYRYLNSTDKTNLEAMIDEIIAGEFSKFPFLFYDDTTYQWVRLRGGINFKTSAYQSYDTELILEEEF